MKKYLNPNIPKPTPGANEGDGTVKIPRQPRPTTPSPRKRPAEGSPRKRTVAGNKEGRASEFYKGSRPMNFLIDTLLPGKPGKVKMPALGGRVISAQKKPVPPKARGAR
jgi:hypothetical protein